jgi:CitB family two-component system response regulator MalR
VIRVLLVEDDPMVAELNRLYVSRVEGFQVAATARDGQEALELLREQAVDLILLDVFMPGPTGLDLLSEIRALDLDVDVILVTAARDTRSIGRALKLGAVDYLIKPFEFERLQQALEKYRETHRLMRVEGSLSQSELDQSLGRPRAGAPAADPLPKGLDRATLATVARAITGHAEADRWFTSEEVAQEVGLSRVSVRKYVEFLCGLKVLRMEPGYGTVGRPVHRFQLQRGYLGELRRYLG